MRSFAEQLDFKALLLADPDVARVLPPTEIEHAFDLDEQLKHVDHIFDRVFNKAFAAEPAGAALRQAQGRQPAVSGVAPRAPR
jgi:hypothetical protein